MSRSLNFPINDTSAVGEARRAAALLCQELSFQENDAGKIGIIVTEVGQNLLKHAKQGQIVIRRLKDATSNGIEVLSIDKGPGMADVVKCMADGYSTAGSPGTGLGAISRLSTVFDIYSQQEKGTVLLSRVWQTPRRRRSPLEVGVICVPALLGDACGDSWGLLFLADRSRILLVDGLGHGPLAARAADEAVRVFLEKQGLGTVQTVESMHLALLSTRGASLAISEIDPASHIVRYCGIGNISATIYQDGMSRSLVSHNGTVGHELNAIREFTYPWSSKGLLVMHSDGLTSRWKLDAHPGLIARHPSVIAGVLFRDYQRGRDDVTVLVARQTTN